MSDQNRNYHYNIKQTSDEKKEKYQWDHELIQNQILNQCHKNCRADSKENYWWDFESERVDIAVLLQHHFRKF